MTSLIEQTVRFASAPEVLFEMYMDSAKHSAATGARPRSVRAWAALSRRSAAHCGEGIF
jgi:hypothetical protein